MKITGKDKLMITASLFVVFSTIAAVGLVFSGWDLGDFMDLIFLSRGCGGCHNGGAAAGSLKTMNGMFATYRKKGYAGLGNSYPVGNDPTVLNNGKYCGLYYEVNNNRDEVTLVGAAEAGADCRADGYTDSVEADGSYIPSLNITSHQPLPEVAFSLREKQGYWFGLMKYYYDGKNTYPYDRKYSKDHYGLVAFPSDYGSSGEYTYIVNEEGTVYQKDLGVDAGYIDTYPGPDPTVYGWEVAW